MSAAILLPLADFCRGEGIRYDWIRAHLDFVDHEKNENGRLYIDPDKGRAYLASYPELPARALAQPANDEADK